MSSVNRLLNSVILFIIFVLLFSGFIWQINAILLPFFISFILSYLLYPISIWMQSVIKIKSLANLLTVLFALLIFLGLFSIFIPFIGQQISSFIQLLMAKTREWNTTLIPDFKSKVNFLLFPDQSEELFVNLINMLQKYLPDIGHRIIKFTLQDSVSIFKNVIYVILVPFLSFYLLSSWKSLANYFVLLFPTKYQVEVFELTKLVRLRMTFFLRGRFLTALSLFIYYAITLTFLDRTSGWVVACIIATFSLVPIMGTIVGFSIMLIFGFTTGFTFLEFLIMICLFLIGEILDNYVFTPYFVGKHVGLNSFWVIFAMLAGGTIAGFWGILMGIPIFICIAVVTGFFWNKYQSSNFYNKL